MNRKLIKQFLNKKNIFAVVGASKNPEKYGHQVYKDLRDSKYEVHPVNPNAEEILGGKCYPDLKNLPRNQMLSISWAHQKLQKKLLKRAKNLVSQRYRCNLVQSLRSQSSFVTTAASMLCTKFAL